MSTAVEKLELESTIVNQSDIRLSQSIGPRVARFLEQTFPRLFAEQVKKNPTQIAVISEDGQLTYAELNERANQLARQLRMRGLGRESLVGICIDRSLDMALGIVGILQAGAAYLPLDPDYPADRLAWLLKDSNVTTVVTKENLTGRLSGSVANILLLDNDYREFADQVGEELNYQPEPSDLTYVIYTSGSTGNPKGVMIEHANLANYLLALQQEFGLDGSDRYLHTASISFSSSRRQLLLPLSQGASVVIANSEERKDPIALFEMIKQREVTVMDAVPSFWRNCTDVLLSLPEHTRANLLDNHLRLMLSASEPLLSDIPQTWMNTFAHPARHIHMFGQTETAGIVCTYRIPRGLARDTSVIPIGRPIANTEIYILDEHGQPVLLGTSGELYIGGAGVGRGYLDRPEFSAHKFIERPFGPRTGRLYRTGDFARLTPDGLLEFTGRQDGQIKIRGFRVELGEIEAVMAQHPGVKENAVVAKEDNTDAKKLIAYFVARETAPTVSELRNFLSERLPDYMAPSIFVQLPALPLTANGKLDKRALPAPGNARPALATKYEAAATETERHIARIWEEVLQVETIGRRDNFFELGGHSLLAIQAIARINGHFRILVPLKMLFEHSTIAALAEQVEALIAKDTPQSDGTIPQVNRDEPLALSFSQQRLWFIDQLDSSSLYNINKAVRLHGALDAERLNRALQSIAARHEVLRTRFVAVDGEPRQLISPAIEIPFAITDLTVNSSDQQAELDRLMAIELETPFDLSQGPLLRLRIFKLAADEHVLLLSLHHIIADAWSVKTFFTELEKFYQADKSETALPQLQIQYGDFAAWQRQQATTEAFKAQVDYWKNQLRNAPFSINLPSDFSMPATPTFAGSQQSLPVPGSLSHALRDVCQRENVTLFMLLAGAFQILLSSYSGLHDILIGTPVAGRELFETESLLGCFINTLVLRGNLTGDPSLREVLRRTREIALDAYTNSSVPFEKLVEELRPERSLVRSPLFQTMLVLENQSRPELALPGIAVEPVRLPVTTAKFDLTLGVVEKDDSLELWLSYSTDLFAAESITAMLADFRQILEAMVANLQQTLSQLPALRWQPEVSASAASAPVSNSADREKPKYVAPRTPIEERLANIWSDVLRVDRVGVLDNFFDLGGHSLLAAQVISRARTALAVELPLRRIFETPNIAGLAEAIYQMQTAETEDDELVAMLAELGQLSEEEAQRRFAEEL